MTCATIKIVVVLLCVTDEEGRRRLKVEFCHLHKHRLICNIPTADQFIPSAQQRKSFISGMRFQR